jgi:uncharacterized protein YdaU (DUF1376 family)
MAKNYSIKDKKVYAVVAKLTEKETREVKTYLDLGFELVVKEPKKISKDEAAAAREKNPYSSINVEAFLKTYKGGELWGEYEKRYNEQAGTNRKEKQKDGTYIAVDDEPKFLKDGTPKKKGFANCIGWFRSLFVWDEKEGAYKLLKEEEDE